MVSALHPLDRKLLRDLWRLRGQAIAIGLIVASGVGVLCSSLAVVDALTDTANAFYDRHRFGHVFATATRAPRHLLARMAAVSGVQFVQGRVVERATLDVPGFPEPIIGTLVSVPEGVGPTLNQLNLRRGTLPQRGEPNGVVLSEAFAEAHELDLGDRLHALINGRRRALDVVGVALSPEYVYSIGPGALMPDPLRYGILWMGERALEAAFDLDGAFNDVSLTLVHGADVDTVLWRVDDLLAPYGGIGGVARKDQLSNWFLMNEIAQLKSMAGVLPSIFLAVAAFLSNMVLARLIATERSEIGLIKAFGYGNATVAWHYAKLVIAIAGSGVLLGWALGWWLGHWTTALYGELYRFPVILFEPGPRVFLIAGGISLLAALAGAMGAVRRAAALAPAEAMRPPAPPAYRRAGAVSDLLERWIDQLTRIVLRQLLRWPLRALLTSLGVATSVAVLVMSLQWLDAIDLMASSFFFDQQRQDLTVALVEKQPATVRREFERLPGVLAVEAHRRVAARLRNGHRSRRQGVVGLPGAGALEVLKDADGVPVEVPDFGIVIARSLAERLEVTRGDLVEMEVLEGARPVVRVPVVSIFETFIGTPAYMHRDALNRVLGDSDIVNTLLLRVDPSRLAELFAALKATPAVGQVSLRGAAVENFYQTIGEHLYVFVAIYVAFACTLAVGVVYNSMRIALSERGRELATLRVLGFHSGEVSYVLLGEAALFVLVAMPMGCVLGYGLTLLMSSIFESELFRVPPVVEHATYGIAVIVSVVASAICGLIVHQRIAHLDLIRVLKTRE